MTQTKTTPQRTSADNSALAYLDRPMGIADIKKAAATIAPGRLLALMESDHDRVARNAAWAMTHKGNEEVAQLPQERLIELVLTDSRIALQRMTLNLIERQALEPENLRSDFLDYCLTHMRDPETPCGVQALCLKLAHRMCSFYPELEHEFKETLRLMLPENYKPGMRHLIKKLG